MTQPISADQVLATVREGRIYVDPAWFRYFVDVGEVDLTADVVGVLPVANGGTGTDVLPSFTAVTFQNAWVNFGAGYDTCAYLKTWDGVVYLKGLMKNGALPGVAFTLPVGYRPSAKKIFAVTSNGAFGAVEIATDGTVTAFLGNNTYVSLEGISFRV